MTGLVRVKFSSKVNPITDLDLLKEHPRDGQLPYLQVSILPVENQDEEKVRFDWTPVSLDEDILTIQLDFDHTYEIST